MLDSGSEILKSPEPGPLEERRAEFFRELAAIVAEFHITAAEIIRTIGEAQTLAGDLKGTLDQLRSLAESERDGAPN